MDEQRCAGPCVAIGDRVYRIVGGERGGSWLSGAAVQPGQAVRIFTGAPVPDGADRVVIQEEASRDGGTLYHRTPAPGSPAYIRPRCTCRRTSLRRDACWRSASGSIPGGCPWRRRQRRARAERYARAAWWWWSSSTGEEIVPAGGDAGPDQIFDAGSPALAALIRRWGGEAVRLAIAGDDEDAIAAAVKGARRSDRHRGRRLGGGSRPGQAGPWPPGPGSASGVRAVATGQAHLVRPAGDEAAACWVFPAIRHRPWLAPSCSSASLMAMQGADATAGSW